MIAEGIYKSGIEENDMRNNIVTVMSFFFMLLVVSVVFTGSAYAGKEPNGCFFGLLKTAGETETAFTFLVEPSEGPDSEFELFSGDEDGFFLFMGESAVVTELVPEGWTLVNVDCSFEGGMSIIVDEDNRVLISCSTIGGGGCEFRNRQTGAIPTLSEWGMISAVLGLGLIGVFFAMRRKKKLVA